MFGSKKPNYPKLRTNLRLCINRLKLMEKKKTELALKARREIADYIAAGKDDRARIRVEHIVREDYLVEAMEIVEMMCDLLLARFGLIDKMKELDPGLEETIATLIWVAPRMFSDIQELREVSNQLTLKYGKEYAEMCRTNGFEQVNEKVIHRMNVAAPAKHLVEQYMVEIAKTYNVAFEPDPLLLDGGVPDSSGLTDLIDLGNDPKRPGTGGSGGGRGGGGGGGMTIPPLQPVALPPGGAYPGPPPHQTVVGCTGEKAGFPDTQPLPPYSGPAMPLPHQPPVGFHPGGSVPPALPHQPPHGYHAGSVPANMHAAGPMPPNYPSLPAYDDVFGGQPGPVPGQPHQQGSNANVLPSAPDPSPPRATQPSEHPSASDSASIPNGGSAAHGGLPNLPAVPDLSDSLGLPSVPSGDVGANSAGGDEIDFDDLTKRFENLKKKK